MLASDLRVTRLVCSDQANDLQSSKEKKPQKASRR